VSALAKSTFAWEPLTPRGVAAFAHAPLSRLLLVQLVVALLTAVAVVWFLDDGCFPVIRAAIQNLPAAGEIRFGRLNWNGSSPQSLAEGKFLAFDIDLNHSGQIQSIADFQIEFGRKAVRVFSLFGYLDFQYPSGQILSFNRTDLEPLWGAWTVEILFVAAVASVVCLLSSWWILATLYFLLVWVLGFFTNRDLNFRASWKFSGAALMPGALLMAAGILLYDFGFLNLVSFGFTFAVHFALGWIYLFLSLLFLPPIPQKTQKQNPFKQAKA
jgi:hypothetical protein